MDIKALLKHGYRVNVGVRDALVYSARDGLKAQLWMVSLHAQYAAARKIARRLAARTTRGKQKLRWGRTQRWRELTVDLP